MSIHFATFGPRLVTLPTFIATLASLAQTSPFSLQERQHPSKPIKRQKHHCHTQGAQLMSSRTPSRILLAPVPRLDRHTCFRLFWCQPDALLSPCCSVDVTTCVCLRTRLLSSELFRSFESDVFLFVLCIAVGQRGEATIINKRAIKQASFLSDTHLLFSPPKVQAQVVALCSTSPASAPQALNRCRHRRRRHQHLEGAPQCGSQCRQRRRRVPCQSCPEGSPARAAREWLHPPL